MRRAPIVLTTTVAGLAGVLSFDGREPSAPTATAATTPAPTSPSTATPPASTGTTSSSGASSAAKGAKISGSFTGDAIDTQYGAAQVRVVIEDGKITDVQAVQLQGNEPKSVEISSRAAPSLRASALAKQSAVLDAVSGATITSASYEASLQSALDKAGFVAADGARGSSTIPQVEEHHDGGPGGPGGDDGGFFGAPSEG